MNDTRRLRNDLQTKVVKPKTQSPFSKLEGESVLVYLKNRIYIEGLLKSYTNGLLVMEQAHELVCTDESTIPTRILNAKGTGQLIIDRQAVAFVRVLV